MNSTNENLMRGDACREARDFDGAEHAYSKLLVDPATKALGYFKLGTVAERRDESRAAEAFYHEALAVDADYRDALNNLGLICAAQGRRDEAEAIYCRLLAEHPDSVNAHINFGNLLFDTGRRERALFHYRLALFLSPESALAIERLGTCLQGLGRVREALELLRRSIVMQPSSAIAWNNFGSCQFVMGRHAEAVAAFDRSVELGDIANPAWSNRLLLGNYITNDGAELSRLHADYGDRLTSACAEMSGAMQNEGCKVGAGETAHRVLRVGFVSYDFRHHSVAYFLLGFLPYTRPQELHLTAYSTSPWHDEISSRLQSHFDSWVDVSSLSDADAADRIRTDQIDILFDLGGHTRNSRPGIFARRPALVQASWIGYPNTTGLATIRYRLTDEWADPKGSESIYRETLLRLPAGFLCYSPPACAPPVSDLPAYSAGVVTFGSFNARVKIGKECIALWAGVLLAVPNSRLLLKSINGLEEIAARDELNAAFVAHGIDAERISVLPHTPTTEEHLDHYTAVDIALDTYPYHGTTTTCEALWMGVPVVTLAGRVHAARVGVSLLQQIGASSWVAGSAEEFVRIASRLASDLDMLSDLRAGLRPRLHSSPLLDGRSMAVRFTAAVHAMYDGQDRVSIEVENKNLPPRMWLHIGGREVKRGWTILDIEQRPEVDIVGDLGQLSELPEGCCEKMYCSHIFQHVPATDVLPTLNTMNRLLAAGGELYFSVPDIDILEWLMRQPGLTAEQRIELMRILSGQQSNESDIRKVGFSIDCMTRYLLQSGFVEIEQVENFGLFGEEANDCGVGYPVLLNLIARK